MRTLVTFESDAYNTSEPRPYFINPGCFGDDVARDLIGRLKARGVSAESEPGQEDFGWYVTFDAADTSHQFVIGFRPDDDERGTWIGWVERNVGLIGTIFGRRKKAVLSDAPLLVHEILAEHPLIRNVRWHRQDDFDRRNEEASSDTPNPP